MKKSTKTALVVVSSLVGIGLLTTAGVTTYQKTTHKTATKDKKGYQSYTVTTTPAGKLQQLNVSDGQNVHQGDILMTVNNPEAQEAVDAQKEMMRQSSRAGTSIKDVAQQANNRANERGKGPSDSQSQQIINDANVDVQEAQNRLVALQSKVTTAVTAPFDGIVSVDYNTKDGLPGLTLNAVDKVLKANVSEYDYHKLHSGDKLSVSGIDGTPTQETTITKIEQIPTDQGKGTTYYPFSATVNNDFLYGQSVKVKIQQSDLKIPKSAVYQGNLYKISDGKAQRISADVVEAGTNYIVKSGIVKGEKIVLNPDSHLKNGEAVHD
ncbi:efflux RND transporter periplasmic adaptor subunit [Leuconostoc citreum]|uniref:efflux RND transporter periplasmic adaptor subunit n=1 Tax=Leuconostoc citreum TaxID=33964 RepID=UPI00295893A4|nr:biotin/lipoyl-binding protein [Leuconostoc citreum]MDV8932568.1 biotin/lipoyl-binding protein [Leuconostoc citreum]